MNFLYRPDGGVVLLVVSMMPTIELSFMVPLNHFSFDLLLLYFWFFFLLFHFFLELEVFVFWFWPPLLELLVAPVWAGVVVVIVNNSMVDCARQFVLLRYTLTGPP